MTVRNGTVVVFVSIGIVAADFHDFGNEAPARPSFEVHKDVYGITDGLLNTFSTTSSNATGSPMLVLNRSIQ